ncbi:MAG: ribonuclease HII [Oscillospiraceae bacterium]|nr:ribonuclease HII [Oscillospiraceae bacterium]
MTDGFLFEQTALQNGYTAVCGIDEAGRGPLAGPVFAAAVILPEGLVIEGLDDSKKLTEKKREALFDIITKEAVSYGIAFATEKEIDEINILQATYLAMGRACQKLDPPADYALIDGNRMPPLPIPGETVVKGDSRSYSIAAASILAKVSRDRLMVEIDKLYPEYRFAKHKGYGTKLHRELLLEYGPCPVHRRSFLTKILGEGHG